MLVAAFLMSTALAPEAGTPANGATTLERAEREFHEGLAARAHPDQAMPHFRMAFVHYKALRRQGVNNTALYRNLGNAAFLADDLPEAILAYRRGLRLDPGDRVLRENLEEARNQVQYPPGTLCRPADDKWPAWLPRLADNLLLGLALGLYAFGCVAITRWLLVRRAFLLLLGAMAIVVASGTAAWWGVRQRQARDESAHPLVVVKTTTPLHAGNGASYPLHKTMLSVARGMEGRMRYARGDWLQVQFPGGARGWLQRDHVLIND